MYENSSSWAKPLATKVARLAVDRLSSETRLPLGTFAAAAAAVAGMTAWAPLVASVAFLPLLLLVLSCWYGAELDCWGSMAGAGWGSGGGRAVGWGVGWGLGDRGLMSLDSMMVS